MDAPNLTSRISHLTSEFNTYAIIVAGGSGSRMQSTVPKQFLLLNGKPVLMYTLEAFYYSTSKPELIVVLPASYHSYWAELCTIHHFNLPHQLVSGGATRFHSVKNGLDLVADDSLVAVHDAVRPLVSEAVIDEAYIQAAQTGTAVVAVKSRDSVRRVAGDTSEALIRDEIYLVQTPQTFTASLLKKAYQLPYQDSFTDDASVAEKAGASIQVVEGSYQNFKITFPEDIALAELLLHKKSHP
jgi:2-C-methyl-D-erythritol 4-phosphate cytidylyltransferase